MTTMTQSSWNTNPLPPKDSLPEEIDTTVRTPGNGVWLPVETGYHAAIQPSRMQIYVKSGMLTLIDRDVSMSVPLPDTLRVCRRIPFGSASASVPDEVVEAVRVYLRLADPALDLTSLERWLERYER